MMDVDIIEETLSPGASAQQQPRKGINVPVDDAHPFDLESYIANYTGRTAIDRLQHIITICPTIAPEAFQLAVQRIHRSRDPLLYQTLLGAYEQTSADVLAETGSPLPSPEFAPLDMKWADATTTQNQAERTKLEVELKTYTNNMIKESIRMAHRDLGDYYRSVGEFPTALKHYTKSREFCTTSQHVLDMCLSVLELLIEQRSYSHLPTYVFKADAALDAASAVAAAASSSSAIASGTTTAAGAAPGANLLAAGKKRSSERDGIQGKLDFATALSFLGQGSYEKAAQHFFKMGSAKDLGDWIGKIVSAGDIAIYGTLCALASYSRSAIKAQVLENEVFSAYIEQEPHIRDLLEAYMASNFKTVLDILSRYSTRHYVDIHLATHVQDLTSLIRNWAVVLYFQPFSSIKLDRMSQAFGWTVEEVERHVVAAIQSGEIQGRVDSQNKVLHAKKTDARAELFAKSIKAAADLQSANRKLILRMKLQQADVLIRPPKGTHLPSLAMGEMIQGD